MERGVSDRDGRRIRSDGDRDAGVSLHRVDRGGDMLRSAIGDHGPDGLGAVRAEILRPHLQHTDPESSARLVPLLGTPCGAALRHGGHSYFRRRKHLRRGSLLPPSLHHHGHRLRRRLRFGHLAVRADQRTLQEDSRQQKVVKENSNSQVMDLDWIALIFGLAHNGIDGLLFSRVISLYWYIELCVTYLIFFRCYVWILVRKLSLVPNFQFKF